MGEPPQPRAEIRRRRRGQSIVSITDHVHDGQQLVQRGIAEGSVGDRPVERMQGRAQKLSLGVGPHERERGRVRVPVDRQGRRGRGHAPGHLAAPGGERVLHGVDQELLDRVESKPGAPFVFGDDAGLFQPLKAGMHFGGTDAQLLAESRNRGTAAVPDEQAEENDDVLGAESGVGHVLFANREHANSWPASLRKQAAVVIRELRIIPRPQR